MTREEAALVRLRLMAHRAFGAMVENRRGGSEEAQKDLDAIDWAIATVQSKIARPQPDPDTGLMPCGCGGEVYPHYQFGWDHGESAGQAFEVSTGCDGCGTRTKPRYGYYVNGIDEDDTESASKRNWNISHGYTAPPRPGAQGGNHED